MELDIVTYKWAVWFRLNGHGFSFKQASKPLTFSQRNGYQVYKDIGPIRITRI